MTNSLKDFKRLAWRHKARAKVRLARLNKEPRLPKKPGRTKKEVVPS